MNKELVKLLARLTALKNNVPGTRNTPNKYADEYHLILAGIEKETKEGLEDFKIPSSEIKPIVTSVSRSGSTYSRENYCDRSFVMMKIDGVLGYFTFSLQPSEIKNQMGFRVNSNE